MFSSLESLSRLEREVLHVTQVPSAASVTVLVFGGGFPLSSVSLFFLSCLLVIFRSSDSSSSSVLSYTLLRMVSSEWFVLRVG